MYREDHSTKVDHHHRPNFPSDSIFSRTVQRQQLLSEQAPSLSVRVAYCFVWGLSIDDLSILPVL